jgi:hypothetical protein
VSVAPARGVRATVSVAPRPGGAGDCERGAGRTGYDRKRAVVSGHRPAARTISGHRPAPGHRLLRARWPGADGSSRARGAAPLARRRPQATGRPSDRRCWLGPTGRIDWPGRLRAVGRVLTASARPTASAALAGADRELPSARRRAAGQGATASRDVGSVSGPDPARRGGSLTSDDRA